MICLNYMINQKYKILLAEDNKILRTALKDKFEREGFLVALAVDGNEVLPQIKAEKPDILLLDIIMPGKTGFDVMEDAKLSGELKNIPIVIISNLGQQSEIKKGLELGAVAYLVKSDLSISGVVEKIKEQLVKKKN